MDLYRFLLFVHVASMTTMFTALGLEWLSLSCVRRADSYEEARVWAGLWKLLLPIGLPALLAVLGSGIYMATTTSAWRVEWVSVAVPTLVLIAVAGALAGPRRSRAAKALAAGAGELPRTLRDELRHPLLLASLQFRSAVILGVLFDMTVRPGQVVLPLAIYLVAVLLGVGLNWAARSPRTALGAR
jgi:hypothetical protein